jgi:phytanoyl-CoA hydroxylase
MTRATAAIVTPEQIAHYRREGYVVVKSVLSPAMVAACCRALSDLAGDRISRTTSNIWYEAGQTVDGLSAEERELKVRRFDSFCADSPVLMAAAMSRRLHGALDQIFGEGRTLFQEMALVKPPEIGAAKPIHQDTSYFWVKDPNMVIGTWTALDRATLENGCMQMLPKSHLGGPKPHIAETLAQCWIPDRHTDKARLVPLEMEPGDTVIFHGLLHHFTDQNRSQHRRRALQFHYAMAGAEWGTRADHERLFADEDGRYKGCTSLPVPERAMRILRGELQRAVVPMDEVYG